MAGNPELVLDAKATLGEGAIWHKQTSLLYWVDIEGCKLHVFDEETGEDRALDTGQPVGTVVPRRSSGVALALHHGFAHMDLVTGRISMIADPEAGLPNRFNDGKCDPAGRFWAGTMPYETGAKKEGGALWCLFPDGHVEKRIGGISCSNGIAWSLDRKTMYYIDTPTQEVWAYDYHDATGAIANRRVVVRVPREEGHPDGMTIDAEGMLWVAHWDGWQVIRWNPITGKKIASVRLPVARVTSCAFGGEALETLYITSARTGLDGAALSKQPHAGGLFRARPGARGVPAFEFGG